MKTTRRAATPLTVFYDGSCRLCSAEMRNLRHLDRAGELTLIDCAAPDFDAAPWVAEGVTQAALMHRMHVRDATGAWFISADAFEVLYRTVGLRTLARAWTHPVLRPFNELCYACVVRHRQLLSRLGFHWLVDSVWRRIARRAAQRTSRCSPDPHECGPAHLPSHPRSES